MKIICYEEGDKRRSSTTYDGIKPYAAAKAFATGWREPDTRPVNVVAIPDDDEARAMPGWKADENEPQQRLFKVEASITWDATEVASFNPYARTA